jgi:hypothetical protein
LKHCDGAIIVQWISIVAVRWFGNYSFPILKTQLSKWFRTKIDYIVINWDFQLWQIINILLKKPILPKRKSIFTFPQTRNWKIIEEPFTYIQLHPNNFLLKQRLLKIDLFDGKNQNLTPTFFSIKWRSRSKTIFSSFIDFPPDSLCNLMKNSLNLYYL